MKDNVWSSHLVAPTHGGCHLDLEMRGAARASLAQQLTFRSANKKRGERLGAGPAVSVCVTGRQGCGRSGPAHIQNPNGASFMTVGISEACVCSMKPAAFTTLAN